MAKTTYINYVTIAYIVLVMILRIASLFINNRDLINWSYAISSINVSNVSYIIIEVIKIVVAKNLNRINIFLIDNESY